jgi:ubiquinone/menaquinone biosynthesis C-methylase UbiE
MTKNAKFDGVEWLERKGLFECSWQRKMDLTERNLEDKVVLDAGCGIGYETHYFSRAAKEVHGIDIGQDDLDTAKDRYVSENLFFRFGSVEQIPYPDSSFDVVYSNWVVEHLEYPQRFIDEAHRVLKQKGMLIIWAPNVKSVEGFLIKMTPHSLKVPVLRVLKQRPDVSELKCYYRANSIRKLDRLCEGKFERTYVERLDHISYYRYFRVLSYVWLMKHKLLDNSLLNWMLPEFYVEYKRCH